MEKIEEKHDKHFPIIGHRLTTLYKPQRKVEPYVSRGQVVADLGCGPGYYALPLAELVGPEGKVYAVDSDQKCIQELEKRAAKHGFHNIEAHATSASDLSFIKDRSVDFVFANGLLCSMAPKQHDSAVIEIRRILKPKGQAYISVARGPWSYVSQPKWEKILEGFLVELRHDGFHGTENWALVSIKL